MTNPVTKTDLIFLKHFSMVIGLLVLITLGLMALAMNLYAQHPPPESPTRQQQVEARIAPVAAVYAGDTGRSAMLQAQEVAKRAAAAQVAYGGTLDGKTIFNNLCQACHLSGAGGAPKMEKALWTPRVAQGMDMLYKHAMEGYTGKSGTMPARGGNASLTDAQVKATVEWMISQTK